MPKEEKEEELEDYEQQRPLKPILKYGSILILGMLIGILSADTTIGQWTVRNVEGGIGVIARWIQQGAKGVADNMEEKPKSWTDEIEDFFGF